VDVPSVVFRSACAPGGVVVYPRFVDLPSA
jgi:hypothetical protein